MMIFSLIFIYTLYDMQIVNGATYRERAQKKVIRTADNLAPRGNIYDRNGKLLVTNDYTYTLNLYRTKKSQDEVNQLLLNLSNVLFKNGDSFINNFPIDFETKEFTQSDSNIKKWKNDNEIDQELDPEEVIEIFTKKYRLQEYDDLEKKILIPVRYELANGGYSKYRATAIAKNVSKESIHELEENNQKYPGIYITKETTRRYLFNNSLSHILGYVGKISSEEYEARKDQNYTINSIVGKSGVESSFEKYLRGVDGKRRIEMVS